MLRAGQFFTVPSFSLPQEGGGSFVPTVGNCIVVEAAILTHMIMVPCA